MHARIEPIESGEAAKSARLNWHQLAQLDISAYVTEESTQSHDKS
jgi:hypothetical protein